jgi:hypothetical protein
VIGAVTAGAAGSVLSLLALGAIDTVIWCMVGGRCSRLSVIPPGCRNLPHGDRFSNDRCSNGRCSNDRRRRFSVIPPGFSSHRHIDMVHGRWQVQ